MENVADGLVRDIVLEGIGEVAVAAAKVVGGESGKLGVSVAIAVQDVRGQLRPGGGVTEGIALLHPPASASRSVGAIQRGCGSVSVPIVSLLLSVTDGGGLDDEYLQFHFIFC